jgi:EAL domain-containing protein (putative c-di-GMP-specific phosphodiesterase class I)
MQQLDGCEAASKSARDELCSALRAAIVQHELVAFYQPIVAFDTGRPTQYEALIRWNRPGLRLLEPREFLRVAEDTGLIIDLGAWMLRRAMRDCSTWQRTAPGIGVCVNVSPTQLQYARFAPDVIDALTENCLDAALLTLEVTEAAIADSASQEVMALRRLHDIGVRLCLDDVAEHSLLSTAFRRLPFDDLKIDESCTALLEDPTNGTALIRGCLELGRTSHVRVIAEGIDSISKFRGIYRVGGRYGQGYFFARPEPLVRIPRGLRQSHARPR